MSVLSAVMREILKSVSERGPRSSLARYEKLDAFIQSRMKQDIYPEYPDEGHIRVTHDALAWIDAMRGLRGKRVLDVGCGRGAALEKLREYGAHATGITFGEDFEVCRQNGLDVLEMDMSFIDFVGESFDLIFARHVLEHSLFPFFTLHVLLHALKRSGMLYAEVPSPDTSANHQSRAC